MQAIPLWLIVTLLLTSCTEPNPSYLGADDPPSGDTIHLSDAAGSDAADGNVTKGDATKADQLPSHDAAPAQHDLAPSLSCQPGSFISCNGTTGLLRCAATGTSIELVDCRPAKCNAIVGQCGTCTMRPYYRDSDGDGYGDPSHAVQACKQLAGFVADNTDCNDHDQNVNPGQTSFFPTAAAGTGNFDYNCDGLEEQKALTVVTRCHKTNHLCSGEGWASTLPRCGETQTWVLCVKDADSGCVQQVAPEAHIQSCR